MLANKKKNPAGYPWFLSGLICFFLCYSCGELNEENTEQDDPQKDSQVTVVAQSQAKKDKISIPLSIDLGQNTSGTMSLLSTSATNFQIQLTDCISGYTTTVNETHINGLEVYQYDRDCIAKLNQFTVGGKTYLPTAADPFTTWQIGDTATFDEAGEPGTNPLKVIVMDNLSNPVTPSDTISYAFADIIKGSDKSILWATFGTSGKILVNGSTEPSFTVGQLELKGQTANEGGQFQLILQCQTDIGVTNECETVLFSDFDYVLVQDTFGGTPTEAQAAAAFSGGSQSITLPEDRIAPGDHGTINGGFFTVTLDGPDDMALNPNMMLIIRSYGESYQYHNIDVVTSTTY